MSFGVKKAKGKGKGFNLDCVLGNAAITVVTCCGFIFQGVVVDEEDDNTRAQYGCPVVFPAMTMGYDHDKECKDDDDKKDKKHHCPQPVEVDVDVKCNNDPKFICLRLTCPPAFVCCPTLDIPVITAGIFAGIIGVGITLGGLFTPLFDTDDTVLIGLDEIAAIGPSVGCLA